MNWLNTKTVTTAIGVALLAGTAAYLVQRQKLVRAETQYQTLLRQQPEIPPMNDQAEAQMEAMAKERQALQEQVRDLPRLRKELTQLSQEKRVRERQSGPQPAPPDAVHPALTASPMAPGKYIRKEQLTFGGYDTPEGSVQTAAWALLTGNYDVSAYLLSVGSEQTDRAQFDAQAANHALAFKGLQILARKFISDNEVELKVRVDLMGDKSVMIWRMVRIGNEWKESGSSRHEPDWETTGTIQTFTP